jgi:hypothetical protein
VVDDANLFNALDQQAILKQMKIMFCVSELARIRGVGKSTIEPDKAIEQYQDLQAQEAIKGIAKQIVVAATDKYIDQMPATNASSIPGIQALMLRIVNPLYEAISGSLRGIKLLPTEIDALTTTAMRAIKDFEDSTPEAKEPGRPKIVSTAVKTELEKILKSKASASAAAVDKKAL